MRTLPLLFFLLVSAAFMSSCGIDGSRRGYGGHDVTVVYGDSAETAAPADAETDMFTVALTGDIMMGTAYPDSALPPDDGRMLFHDVAPLLCNATIAVGNLEGTLCDSAPRRKNEHHNSYSFRTPVAFASRLSEAGYDFLSLANNHSFDFGISGVRSTEHALDSLGISYAGIRRHSVLALIERDGVRYGLCAFGHNYHTLRHQDLKGVKNVLDSLRGIADIVVVSFHGGGEGKAFSRLPYGKEEFLGEDRGTLRDFAHFCIDNGADIVFGHGPHVVRCVELYKNRFIAYSLGNFCTPYSISIMGVSGYAPVIIARTDRHGRFLGGHIYSFIQRKGLGPRRDTTNAVVRQIRDLTAVDMPDGRIKIRPDGEMIVAD